MSSPDVGRQRAPLRGARLRGAEVARGPLGSAPRACLLDPSPPRSLRATAAEAYHASRNRRRHRAWGAPPLVRFGSVAVARSWGSAAIDRPPRGATTASPRDRRRSHVRGNRRRSLVRVNCRPDKT
jgi:hypothetical protein